MKKKKTTWRRIPRVDGARTDFVDPLRRVLFELVSDAFLVRGPIGMIILALVAVGAFLAVRTRLGQWGGQLHFLSQKLVQGGTIFTKGIVRWHKPNKEKRGNHQMALAKVIVSHLNHASDKI